MTTVLTVFSASDLNCPSSRGLIADKLDAYIFEAQEMGAYFHHALIPNGTPFTPKSAYLFSRFPRAFVIWFLSSFSFVFRILRAHQLRTFTLRIQSRILKRSWVDLLNKLSPDVILGIGLTQELLAVTAEREIPAIEVQHGAIDIETISNYWPTLRPSLFLCWDNQSVETSSAYGVTAVKSGHPFVAKSWIGSLEKSYPSKTYQNLDSEKYFCVALAWGVRKSQDPTKSVHPILAVEVSKLISRGYIPIFRIHPVAASNPFVSFLLVSWLKSRWPKSFIEKPRTVPAWQSVRNTRFLITFSSAMVFEFALYGKPSILLEGSAGKRLGKGSESDVPNAELVFGSYESLQDNFMPQVSREHEVFRGGQILIEYIMRFASRKPFPPS